MTTSDGTRYPWAMALDGIWHLRPRDDDWTRGAVQADTLCGLAIASVEASSCEPDPTWGVLCAPCQTAQQEP